jgi:hypothetical protein
MKVESVENPVRWRVARSPASCRGGLAERHARRRRATCRDGPAVHYASRHRATCRDEWVEGFGSRRHAKFASLDERDEEPRQTNRTSCQCGVAGHRELWRNSGAPLGPSRAPARREQLIAPDGGLVFRQTRAADRWGFVERYPSWDEHEGFGEKEESKRPRTSLPVSKLTAVGVSRRSLVRECGSCAAAGSPRSRGTPRATARRASCHE